MLSEKITRPTYLKQLIAKRENGLVKIITGNRRCGKSYLLFTIPLNLANTFKTVKHKTIAPETISTYLGYFMENIIFNELKVHGYDVDVGVVEHNSKDANGKSHRNYLEIDFVANKGSKRFYIQSALHVDDEEKRKQETNSLRRVNDSFKKIIILKDNIEQWQDDNGIQYVGVEQFLLDKAFLS